MNDSFFFQYAWYELWNPVLLLLFISVALIYYKQVVTKPLFNTRFRHWACFYLSFSLVYAVKGSPLALIGNDHLFSVHLLNISILLFIAVPLFVLSFPPELLRRFFWHHKIKKAIRLFSHPWIAAVIFNGTLTIYLVPVLFNVIHGHIILKAAGQTILVLSGILMWWTIINPLKEIGSFSYFIRVSYVFLNSLLLMPLGIFLILSMSFPHYPLYEPYSVFANMTGTYDQQIAGAIFKAVQMLGYGTALCFLIIRWGKEEEKAEEENIRVVQGIVIQLPERK